MYELGVRY